MLALAWPFGCPARFADPGGAQTRCAQTVRAFSPASAARLGLATGQFPTPCSLREHGQCMRAPLSRCGYMLSLLPLSINRFLPSDSRDGCSAGVAEVGFLVLSSGCHGHLVTGHLY